MKLELLNDTGDVVALIEGAGRHGVVVSGPKAACEASSLVNASRAACQTALGKVPNGDEILEFMLTGEHASRLRKVTE